MKLHGGPNRGGVSAAHAPRRLSGKADIVRTPPGGSRATVLGKYLPLLSWLPSYQPRWLRADLIAGLTVWAVLVPESVAYAQLAGVPAVAGLAAAPVALLAYALFGSTRQAVVGGTSALAIMSAATVAPLAAGHTAHYWSLNVGLALLVGILALLGGLLRLGFVASFLSRPVLIGFTFGLGMVVAIGQVPKLLGIPDTTGSFFKQGWHLATHLGSTNALTLLIGAGSLTILFGLRRLMPRLPAALIALSTGTALATVLGPAHHGLAVVGTIPAGLPRVGLPDLAWHDVGSLLPSAFGLVLVGYAEHLAAIRKGTRTHNSDLDPDQELIALGVANIGAGLLRGFAVGGSLSKTTVNNEAGAQTQLSGTIAALLVVVTSLFLTPLFANVPEATLGAIVIAAVWGLFDVGELRRFYRMSREGFAFALTALLGELVFNVLPGLLVAVGLSFIVLVYRSSRPHLAVLGRFPGERTYADLTMHPENETIPGLLLVRLDAQLFFANDAVLHDRLRALVRTTTPQARAVLLDLEATMLLDISSADTLAEIAAELHGEGIALLLARVRDPVLAMLRRGGVAASIGEDHIYHMVDEGVRDFLTW